MDWQYFLIRANDVLTIGVGVTAFALGVYLWAYNRESRVARAFLGLLGCVLGVYLVDLLLTNITNLERASALLRMQWIGITFTPAFYLMFVRAIRRSVLEDHAAPWLGPTSFLTSAAILLCVVYTDWVVSGGRISAGVFHMQSGPLFYPFAVYLGVTTLWGVRATLSARQRCYTRAARRRMAYLSIGFVAPAMGVFPYLLLTGWPSQLPTMFLWLFLIVGNVAVASMLVLMAYSVAFIGVFTPDRVIKHRLVRFLLRGPLTAILALSMFAVGWLLEPLLGLGPFTLSLIAMGGTVVLAQLGVELAKPLLDLALYREGHVEVAQVQELSQRLLTTADLRQFLENVLAALCEALHSKGGFLAILVDDKLSWEIWCDLWLTPETRAEIPLAEVARANSQDRFIFWDGYWVLPIHDREGQTLLGLAGLQSPEVALPLSETQDALLTQLRLQITAALEDRRLQQEVFAAFSPLLPELKDIQQRGQLLRYEGQAVEGFSTNLSTDLPQWVHDALAHYWGGPRLTENPLLDLAIVKQAAIANDGNPVKGLRTVLTEAIEQLRPDGERKLTAPEWLLYNILEMKFLRGHKVREVTLKLAVSEADFYRKQRVAIENLAQIIAEMEKEARKPT
ncbi:MAG TPA: histidine kinase N-terminal 7TM domain-containing protein [Anaerolineae bacterium]|nr:histidine kinase N-terminal 7TM domain-containing protein [Anaerolineae bacterium]